MVDFESFLLLNRLLRCDNPDKDEVIRFLVRYFDPKLLGFVRDTEFESLIREIFEEDDDGDSKQEG